ncbi:ZmpA/ZmpB/ZmpC family metallo-endopeptidase, partial [Gemelliphila palaticanis]
TPKEEINTTEEVEQPKETENVEEGKSDSTAEETPKEEANPTEEVEKPKETESVEEGNSNSTVEEKPKEEVNPTEEVEQPKETPSVEEVNSNSTVEEKPKEEVSPTEEEKPGKGTNPAEEVEQPKETPNVEEEKSDSTVEEKPSAETTTTEEVEQPKETSNIEEGNSGSTVEEKPKEEVNPTEEKELLEANLSLETLKAKVQEAEAKKIEISNDKLIKPTEKSELDKLIEDARTLKSEATDLVNSLKDSDKKDELSKELTLIHILSTLEVNDKNANGKIDTTIEAEAAEAKVQEAKEAAKKAADKKQELVRDEAISEEEKSELDRLISEANTKKSEAERLVNNLPLSDKKETLKTSVSSINNIPTTVEVNDKNANGKIDTTIEAEAAEAKVQEAKEAANRAATKKQELEKDGSISEEEKSELDRLISEANTKKAEAERLVNNLPLSDKKETLKTIVSSINNIPTTVVVNDKNANGKIDTTIEAEAAEAKVQEAKEAANRAADKKQALEKDGAISEEEKSELDRLISEANTKKSEADTEVNNLPISDKKDSLTEELYRVSIPESLEVTPKEETKEELKETKIEFKNVEHAYLYKLNNNNEFEKVLSIDEVGNDLSKYKVKAFLKDANKNIWLDVKSINLLDNKYKVDTSFDNIVSIDNNLKVTDTYSIEVAKRNISEVSEYNSFTKLINAMKSVGSTTGIINGTYILSDNLSASEISVNDSDKSYLDNYTFMGTLMSKTGKVFSINDLKKPLFNSVNSSEISNISINSADVSVERYDEVGVLANNVSSSTINNVIVKGRITGNSVVGGIVGVLDNASSVINSSFIGRVSSLHSAGGISSRVTRGSSIKNSYSDVEISVTARLDSNIGGITGELGENSSIENSYVKGIITNNGDSSARVGGVIGAVYDSSDDLKDNGKIVNVITFTAVNNGNIFIGNISDLKASSKKDIKNNYLVENYSKGTYIDFDNKISYINFNNANEKVNLLYKNIVEESLLKNDSTVDYKNSKYYKESHQKAYENMSKLLPFYDRYTIVREANKLDYQDNLNKKTIKSIQTFVGDELVKDLYNQKQYVDSILIHYTDGTNEKLKISLKGEFKNSGIIDYTVDNKNIIYHINRFAKDNNREMFEHILEYLKNSKFSYKIFNPHNLADWDESSINKFLGKLYLEDNFENIKIDLENTLSSLIDNYDIYNYNSKEFKNYIKNRLEVNKNSILVGLNYLDRWYNFGNVKNNLLHSINVFSSDKNSLDLVLDLGSRSRDILSSKATDSAYDQIVSKYTGINNINEFIKESYINEKDQTIKNIDEWIKNTTKAYIVSEESKEIASANEGIFGRLSRPKLRRFILPLLTVKEKNVYAFFTSNSSNFGIYDPYIKSKNKDSIEYKKEVEIIEKNINNAAKAMQGYFDALYRILDKKSVDKLLGIKIQVFDSYKDSRNNWSKEYGPRAFSSVKALAGPVNRWIDYEKKAGAYALNSDSIEVVHFSDGNLLTERGLSTLSHEHVHNLDSKVLLGGYGRRFGHGAESFAMGLLQSPYVASQSLGINLVYEVSDSDRYLLTHNSSPKRFQNTDDLQQYMRGVFDVLYTLDLAEAEVILEEGNEYIGENYKILTAEKEIGNANKDIIKRISGTPNVKTLNDLIDNNIIGPEPASKEYANNDYININMFNANYGINENPDHTSGGFTFRRVAFELLAEKGYYDGMLPYISNKYYYTEKNTDNEKTNSDTYILKKIFNNKYASYKDFRKDMFDKRNSRKNDIKSVTVWGIRGNNRVTINSYNDLKNLIRRAIRTNNRNTLLNIKQSIYHEYLILTNEFRESIYKQN